MSHVSDPNNNKKSNSPEAKALQGAFHCSIVPVMKRSEKSNSSTGSNRLVFTTQSDGNIIKIHETGFKQKLVNKVRSWSNKEKFSQIDLPSTSNKQDLQISILSNALENSSLSSSISEENIYQPEVFKAKDSLESILVAKTDKNNSTIDSRSAPMQDVNVAQPLHSDPTLTLNTCGNASVKHLTWDPWNKLGRKNKRDKKRKEKSPHTSSERTVNNHSYKIGKDHVAGDEPQVNAIASSQAVPRNQETYEYQPYKPNRKSVEFVNEVSVMYFTGDEIISKAMEPLKKELDQQIRNKEMRRGHVPCTLLSTKDVNVDDYMSAWFKK